MIQTFRMQNANKMERLRTMISLMFRQATVNLTLLSMILTEKQKLLAKMKVLSPTPAPRGNECFIDMIPKFHIKSPNSHISDRQNHTLLKKSISCKGVSSGVKIEFIHGPRVVKSRIRNQGHHLDP